MKDQVMLAIRNNASCRSINYETGLCVLFSSSADQNSGQLTPSQFPVFTIYLQKNCLPSAKLCDAAWSFERVLNHQLDTEVRRSLFGWPDIRSNWESHCRVPPRP